jgi:hypothetical protein
MADTLRVSNLYSSQVGIGTTTPSASLQILNASMNRLTGLYIGPSTQSGIVLDSTSGVSGKSFNIWSTSSGDSAVAGSLVFFDITAGAYRMVISPSGQVGIGTTGPGYTLHVVGSIFATGNVTAYSDQRYKQNIVRLDHSLDAIRSLSGYSYTRLDYLPGVRQIGLLAQEVKEVLPEAVSYDSTNDIYSVNYNCLMAPVVEAIKELYDRSEAQAAIIQAQQLTIQKLLDRLGSL